MDSLIYLALGLTLLAGFAAFLRPEREGLMATAAAGTLLAALLFLISRYLLVDLDYQVVFLYTREGLPWYYRLSGAWTSREGSLLVWTFWLALVAALYRGPRVSRTIMYGFVVAFLFMLIRADLFAATPEYFLQGRPMGNGLNPSLQSPFMLIHPPLMFLAYAMATIPAAKSLQHLATGDGSWSGNGQWMRLNWMLYTFAMGLGGMWAYYTLGFGGYWAWDPVEVANLLPWLALGLFLHARLHHQKHGDHAVIGPLLGLLPFLFTIFSTLSTRSGLWVSVHAFTDPTDTFDPDAGARFLGILELEPSVSYFLGLMMATAFVALALFARRVAIDEGKLQLFSRAMAFLFAAAAIHALLAPRALWSLILEAKHLPGGILALFAAALLAAGAPVFLSQAQSMDWRKLDRRVFVHYSVLVLGLGLLVLTLFHFQSVNGWSQAFYEERLPLLALPVVMGTAAFQLRELVPKKFIAIALFPVLLYWEPTLALISGALFAAAIATWRIMKLAKPEARLAGGILLLAGLADVLFWSSPPAMFGFHPRWPMQLLVLPSLWVMWQGLRVLQGHQPHRWVRPAALLFGYGIGLLALWKPSVESKPRPILRELGTHGIHFAVAIAILGYAVTTLQTSTEFEIGQDETVMLAGTDYRWSETQVVAEPGTPWGSQWRPVLSAQDDVSASLYWELQTGSHYPLPGTLRTLTGDVYLKADALCLDDKCADAVRAYEPSRRIQSDAEFARLQGELIWIPGIGLVWGALALLVGSVAVIVVGKREAPVGT